MRLPDHPLAEPDEVTYEHYDEDKVFLQRACPAGCDHGLLLAPVRFCGRCVGSGYVTRIVPAARDL